MERSAIRRKFLEEGWEDRLNALYKPDPRPYGDHKTHTVWWDGDDVMGEIREYDNPGKGGYQLIVCQFREGEILWYDPMTNPLMIQ
ncbi:MAG TPA: hypothetical protein VMB85_06430 [Bryobacteraceae bacterium]|nr:hypothetical protein [Bryobacteraceae bacterium]